MTNATVTGQAARDELYEVIRKEIPFEQKAREALELGKRYLGADNGHLTQIDQETSHWEIIATTDPVDGQFPPGLMLDLETTYCRRVIKPNSPIALHDAPNQGWDDDPAFETHGLHCYHGTPIVLNDEPYGTVCFVSEDPRNQFNDGETMFAELIAQLLERELEQEQYETKLTRQTNLSLVLNRVLRHNLRNDMSVIRGFTQMMADKLDDSSYSDIALDNIDGLIRLSEKARQLDRIVAADFKRESTNITGLIEELAETVAKDYPNASVSVEYDEEVTAAIMPTFERALSELIENAVKHSGDSPTVSISVINVPNAVEIRIVDDGPGLADHEADVLLTGTETQLTHGSGLGLWISHWIVTSHDGSVDATVTDDGTTMTLSVPRQPTSDVQKQLTKLQRARDQYQAAFEEANDAMVILNDDAKIIDANPEASSIYGLDQQAILGQPFQRFLPDEFNFEDRWSEFKKAGSERGKKKIVGDDGVERHIEYSATANIIPGQHLVVSRDITDRKERERELRETKQRLDLALQGSDTGVWDWDMDTGDIHWDETMERLFGIESGTFEGTLDAFIKRIHPDDRSDVETAIQQSIESEEQYEATFRIQRDDGEQRWVNARGEIFPDDGSGRMVGIISDITRSKENELALASARKRYKTLLDAAPDPVFVADAERGEVIEVNEAAETLLGRSVDEIVGLHFSEFHPSDRSEQYRQLFEGLVETGRPARQLPDGTQIFMITDSGEQIPVEISADTVSLPDQTVIFGIFRDISEQLTREQELQRKTQAMDKAPVGITLSDPDQEDNPLVYANERFHELTGYGADETLGRNCRLMQGDGTDPDTVASIRQAIECQEPVTETIRNYRKNGTPFWNRLTIAPVTDKTGSLMNYIGFQEDVTERIERDQTLEETTQRLQAIIEASPDAIVALDADGTIQMWNDAAEDMYGYNAETVIGESVQSLGFHRDDHRSEFERNFERALAGDTLRNHEISRQTKNGDYIHLSLSTAPITNRSGEITGVVGIAKDVTGDAESSETA